ncbi:alpha/beta hydrolase family protein [Prosthecobacter vanneervenii]|uniref:Dienelactone hydrolase n=1 Tax=Prosthecobacter vanneervenii TaxID=48466 RepID=A0A7W7Y770_9BACT|nr:acetylxylan esterase [Prosthecobacter vanneervenii]MBB5030886.1 dienelactone hydrolase [Prosthecobacter vanneervenii]
MKAHLFLLATLACTSLSQAEDIRQQPPKDLNGYFPFNPPSSLSEWDVRKEQVRRQILVAEGLWPMPTKTPLNAVVHGKVEGDGFTVEKVYFESAPGFYVTGSLWKPKEIKGKVPGVMFAHGHWKDARLSLTEPDKLRAEIAAGGERFERGGKSIFQSLCVQLARMGCVVWQWDMLSDSDSVQIPREIVHTFAKQRPEMNTEKNWGLFSPQAEAHLQSIMGLQTWNAVRGLDFLLSLPEVDPERTAITGASGGGTQTMLLAAIDDRIKLSFPCVMVSTAMQGGCTCENTSLLRIGTGNVEFAGLFAPKPQGMNTANDWTKEMATKGFPDLQKLYTTYGAKDNVFLLRGEHFPHNYNAVTRSAFYTFVNKHFKLGFPSPVIENDYEPLTKEQLSVWDDKHPAPKAGDPEFERKLLAYLTSDAEKQLSKAEPKVLQQGVETVIGRSYDKAGEVEWTLKDKEDKGDHLAMSGTLTNKTYQEELAVCWLYPKQWNGRVVIWLDDAGKSGISDSKEVKEIVAGGSAVLGVDLLFQGNAEGKQNRVVANPREFAGYTYGYNHALYAQRVHDVLTLTTFLRNTKVGTHPSPKTVHLAAFGEQTGPIAVAARALAGNAIDRAAIDTHGFRFGKLLDYRDPMFLPGGAKYQDLPGMLSLQASLPQWVKGEGKEPKVTAVKWLME